MSTEKSEIQALKDEANRLTRKAILLENYEKIKNLPKDTEFEIVFFNTGPSAFLRATIEDITIDWDKILK